MKTLEVAKARDIAPEDFLADLTAALLGYIFVHTARTAESVEAMEEARRIAVDLIVDKAEQTSDAYLALVRRGMA